MGFDASVPLSRLGRGNRVLFRRDDACLGALGLELSLSDRRTVALWGVWNAERIARGLSSRYPGDPRPSEAVRLSRMWMSGDAKMREARAAILAVHAMAADVSSGEDAALCRAVGQGCSCVHTPKHGLGLPIYELTALVLRDGATCGPGVERAVASYRESLERCRQESARIDRWAGFLRGSSRSLSVRSPDYHKNIYSEIWILQKG